MTYASAGFASAMNSIAPAAAAARQMLIAAAASVWGFANSKCEASGGFVLHQPVARSSRIRRSCCVSPPNRISSRSKPKTRDAWKVLGHSKARPDIPERVNGRAKFGIDVVIAADAVCGNASHAPRGCAFSRLGDGYKTRKCLKRKGVLRWVVLPHAVAVVANSFGWRNKS